MTSPKAILPATQRFSCRLYLRLEPGDIAVLKFLLEADDNLAYLSTVSPHTAVAKVVFAPEREPDVREFLETVQDLVTFSEMMMSETVR